MSKQKIKIDNAVSWAVHLYYNPGFQEVFKNDITRINLAMDVALEIVGLKINKANRSSVMNAMLYKLLTNQKKEIIL